MVSDGSWWDCDTGSPISGGGTDWFVGDGSDSVLSFEGTFNLGINASNGRTYADGIAYKVTSNPDSTSINIGQIPYGFANGDKAMLINLQGTAADNSDVGNYEILDVTGTSGNDIVVSTSPTKSYVGSGSPNQMVVIQRIPQYGDVTLDGDDTLTVPAWDSLTTTPTGAAGFQTGIIAFYASGTVDISGNATIDASLKGFRGGASGSSAGPEYWGGRWTIDGDSGNSGGAPVCTGIGGPGGAGGGSLSGGSGGAATQNGGDGSTTGSDATGGGGAGGDNMGGTGKPGGQGYLGGGGGGGRGDDSCSMIRGGGGGGGKPYSYGSTETTKTNSNLTTLGYGAGSAAGGGGGATGDGGKGGAGGTAYGGNSGNNGGGIIYIVANEIITNQTDQIISNGGTGGIGKDGTSNDYQAGAGGGGAGASGASGGSIYIEAQTMNLSTNSTMVKGGAGGAGGTGGTDRYPSAPGTGGAGGAGGIWLNGNDVGGAGRGGGNGERSGGGGGGGGGSSGFTGKVYLKYQAD